jgi:chromate transporter
MFFEQLLNYEIVRNAFAGIRVAVSLLIIQAAIKMITKMMKKTSSKKSSILLVGFFFVIVLFLNIIGVNISAIYLIIISGIIGFCLYVLPTKKGAKK